MSWPDDDEDEFAYLESGAELKPKHKEMAKKGRDMIINNPDEANRRAAILLRDVPLEEKEAMTAFVHRMLKRARDAAKTNEKDDHCPPPPT